MTDDKKPIDDVNLESSQHAVIEFLSDETAFESYNGFDKESNLSQSVTRIDTHSAHLFLVGNCVFKIKRAVRYSYLDMSALSTRHLLCRRELELNKSVLPQIYQAVLAVTREVDGSLKFNGQGPVQEWVLYMKRFPEHDVLDNIARAGELTTDLAATTGRSIAHYHASLNSEVVQDGYLRIHEVVEELIEELGPYAALFTPQRLNMFRQTSVAELASCKALLDERAQQGHVKRCHGDLHLRNLVLIDGIPVPFDALEFDERMATTDVLYDLAFILMDLDHRKLCQQSSQALNQYLLHSVEQSMVGIRLLPLFMFCRAGIRAMTTAQAASLGAGPSAASEQEAVGYFDLALQYLHRRKPVLVAIGGLSGAGKSTISVSSAYRIGSPRGAILLRSDAERKVSQGLQEVDTLPAEHYTANTSSLNYERLLNKAALALDAGWSVMVDAVFLDEQNRLAIQALADQRSLKFHGIWLNAPAAILEQRITRRVNDASDATTDVLKKQLQVDRGIMNWQIVDASGTAAQVLDQIDFSELQGSAE